MIFYLVPAAAGRPAMLQPTQADANREARERNLKVRAPDMEHEVPTSKADLMAYINDLLMQRDGTLSLSAVTDDDETVGCVTGDPHSEDIPPTKAMSQTEVDALFTPKVHEIVDLPRDKVCELISTYSGHDLGFVALEVATRFETLGRNGQ